MRPHFFTETHFQVFDKNINNNPKQHHLVIKNAHFNSFD